MGRRRGAGESRAQSANGRRLVLATRREEKQRLRQIREEAERREAAEQRRKLLVGYAIAGALSAAVIAGIVVVVLGSSGGGASGNSHIVNAGVGFSTTTENLKPDDRVGIRSTPGPLASAAKLTQAAKAAGCVVRNPPNEGRVHLLPSQPTPHYGTDPPTSGNHDPIPLANGVYDAPITDYRHAVHSLEHGRIEVEYRADLSQRDQLMLKGVIDEDFLDMIMFQNPTMHWQVAAAAWTHYLGCPTYNPKVLDAIRAFRDAYRGQGPEPSSIQPS